MKKNTKNKAVIILIYLLLPAIVSAGPLLDNAPRLKDILYDFLLFIMEILGLIALLGVTVSGLMYFTASGNEDRMNKAKSALSYSIIGLVISLSAIIVVKSLEKMVKAEL